uniref:Uncharacterized protein n=1 Tax=Glossina palpalis gambiensis TaxID=67801 RepID=A0A1B0BW19_9MUSC
MPNETQFNRQSLILILEDFQLVTSLEFLFGDLPSHHEDKNSPIRTLLTTTAATDARRQAHCDDNMIAPLHNAHDKEITTCQYKA